MAITARPVAKQSRHLNERPGDHRHIFLLAAGSRLDRRLMFAQPYIDADQCVGNVEAYLAPMARYDWTYVLSLAASLALAVGAICILVFAM